MSDFTQKDKLLDYLEGLKDLQVSSSFPIGTIIIQEQQRTEVSELLRAEKLSVLEVLEDDTENLIKELFGLLESKTSFVLEIKKTIPELLMVFLQGLAEGKIEIVFTDGSKKIMDRVGRGLFVTLVLTQELYQQSNLENISSSFCNLTR